MAVKSKKVARKKEGLPKKTAKAKPRASKSVLRHAKAVQIEVVSDFPDLMPPVFVEQISKVRGMISQANDLSDADRRGACSR